MKKLPALLLLLLFSTYFSFGQSLSLSPAPGDPICPNTPMTWTVLGEAGADLTVQPNASNGLTGITSGTDNDGNMTVTALVQDAAATLVIYDAVTGTDQTFKINSSTLSGVTPKFVNPSPRATGSFIDTVPVPFCSTASINYTGPEVFYQYNGSNSGTGMTNYDWLAPSGWSVNGTVSDGTTPIGAGTSVTLVPTASSGGTLQFWALNNCNPALKTSNKVSIKLSRTTSSALTANNVNPITVTCGAGIPLTFTLSNPPACVSGYKWTMPTGWEDGSGNVVTSVVTTTPTITLTPEPYVQPSNVTVALMVNGSATTQTFTESVNYTETPVPSSISGPESFCGTSQTYTLAGLTDNPGPSNFTVDTHLLTGSITQSTSGNTLTLTNPGGSAYGYIYISASTPTGCGISTTTDAEPSGLRVLVGQPPPGIYGFTQGMYAAGGTGPYTYTMALPTELTEPVINYNWNITPHVTITGSSTQTVSFTINPPPQSGWTTVSLIVEYETACGWSNFLSTYFYAKPGSGGGQPPPPRPLLRPTASGGTLAILADAPALVPIGTSAIADADQANVSSPPTTVPAIVPIPTTDGTTPLPSTSTGAGFIKSVVVFNTIGQVRKKIMFGGNNTTEYLDVSDLSDGIYFFRIETTKTMSTEKYFIHR